MLTRERNLLVLCLELLAPVAHSHRQLEPARLSAQPQDLLQRNRMDLLDVVDCQYQGSLNRSKGRSYKIGSCLKILALSSALLSARLSLKSRSSKSLKGYKPVPPATIITFLVPDSATLSLLREAR